MSSRYLVWCPDLGQDFYDAKWVIAGYEEQAACIWAHRQDISSADYWIVGGQEANVVVRDAAGKETRLIVTGESQPVYRARPA